jgi:trk system potassium uptake protein TrkH
LINLRNIASGLSTIAIAAGLVMVLPIFIALLYAEYFAVPGFALPMAVALCVGFVAYKGMGPPVKLTIVEAMAIASMGWLLAAALFSVPYVTVSGLHPLDAYFEAFSSLTTTGMTVIPVLEDVPRSILFWRALGEWVGGIGIILLTTLLLLSREGVIAWRMYLAEAREERLAPTIRSTIKDIWLIYVLYTALCAISLILAGLDPFDALCHALTCLSTGGFSTKTSNVGAFNNVAVEVLLIIFMILGATRFSLHYKLFTGDVKSFAKDLELRVFVLVLITSSVIVSLDLALRSGLGVGEALRIGFFHVVSVGTTTGFTTKDLASDAFSPLSKAVLLFLMIIGGCSNSTAGGIKVQRLTVLAKLAKHEVEKTFLPAEAFKGLRLEKRVLREAEALRIASFFFLYMFFALLATTVMVLFEGDFLGCLSGVLSAMATVGPFYMSTLSLSPASKIVLIISMWVGRLELVPALILLSPKFWSELSKFSRKTSTSKLISRGQSNT